MKKSKLIMSIITCCFALGVLAFGVYASLSVNFNLSGKISFDPNGVDATITTQVFKYKENITHDDAYLKAYDLQSKDFDTLASSYDILTEKQTYKTKEGNTYYPNLKQDLSESVLNFEDCEAYFIVVHVLPSESYSLEEHNQIVFVELTQQELPPDNVWLAYNDKYLAIYPSAQQDGGLSMVFFIGITEPYIQVPENNFSLNLSFEYKDIYQLGENDTIKDPFWNNAGPDDVYIMVEQLWDEEDNQIYYEEIVVPETVEKNGTKKVVGVSNDDGNELYCNKLILSKNCTNLTEGGINGFSLSYQSIKDYFVVDQRNKEMSSLDNMLFNKDKTMLILASDSYTSYTIPSFVNIINDYYVFLYCEKLEKVIIPEGITEIANNLFLYCSSLTSITIPDSVTSIGYGVFDNTNLSSIYIPASMRNISSYVFADIQNDEFTIYCEVLEDNKPDGWGSGWNAKDHYGNKWTNIQWGVTRERYNEIVNGL